MNSSPQAPHRSPCSTNVKPSISEVISSAGRSLRFPQLGHRVARLSLGSRDDEDLIVFGVVCDHQLLLSLLLNEDLPLSLSNAQDPEGVPQRFPQVGLIPVPFSHPGVPEVFAHVNVDSVDVEREQSHSLSYVMNFIYIKIWMGRGSPGWSSHRRRHFAIAYFIRAARLPKSMPSVADFREIYEYNWRVLRDYGEALAKLPEDELLKNREATHESLKNIFHHILSVHDGWLNVTAQGASADPVMREKDFDEVRSMEPLRGYLEKIIAKEKRFLAKLTDKDLDRGVQPEWKTRPHPLRDALLQVTFEQAPHRRAHRAALANRRRAAGDDLDRRAPLEQRRSGTLIGRVGSSSPASRGTPLDPRSIGPSSDHSAAPPVRGKSASPPGPRPAACP